MEYYRGLCFLMSGYDEDLGSILCSESVFDGVLYRYGVRHLTAGEMVRAHRPKIAIAVHGTDIFLPPSDWVSWWHRGVALALLFERVRALMGEPIRVRNWWRPAPYNARVGGATRSDHIDARAIDLDFGSEYERGVAEGWLVGLQDTNTLRLSLGLGGRSIHLGLPAGTSRKWYYKSHPDYRK